MQGRRKLLHRPPRRQRRHQGGLSLFFFFLFLWIVVNPDPRQLPIMWAGPTLTNTSTGEGILTPRCGTPRFWLADRNSSGWFGGRVSRGPRPAVLGSKIGGRRDAQFSVPAVETGGPRPAGKPVQPFLDRCGRGSRGGAVIGKPVQRRRSKNVRISRAVGQKISRQAYSTESIFAVLEAAWAATGFTTCLRPYMLARREEHWRAWGWGGDVLYPAVDRAGPGNSDHGLRNPHFQHLKSNPRRTTKPFNEGRIERAVAAQEE